MVKDNKEDEPLIKHMLTLKSTLEKHWGQLEKHMDAMNARSAAMQVSQGAPVILIVTMMADVILSCRP